MCEGPVHPSLLLGAHEHIRPVVSTNIVLLQISDLTSGSYVIFPPSSTIILILGRNKTDTVAPLRAEHSTISYSPHIDQPWVSILIDIYCKMKLL